MRNALITAAQKYLDGDSSYGDFMHNLIIAIDHSPDGPTKADDLHWLAERLVYGAVTDGMRNARAG